MNNSSHILPDVLSADIRAVICGTAAGNKSAVSGSYYSDPSNCFWNVLQLIGLTPHRLTPCEFATLPNFGLGLTDLAKTVAGADSTLPLGAFDLLAFGASIRHWRPSIVAFNGKTAARTFYGISKRVPLEYGLQAAIPDFPLIFVLPSTSGSARRYWNLDLWHEFARLVKI